MRWSQTLIPTVKDDHSNVRAIGDRLMIRAGLIRELGGKFGFLPLGFRCLEKAASLFREKLDAIGAQEVVLLGPQDAAAVEQVAGSCIRSYKQLPLSLFQFSKCSHLTVFTFCPDERTAAEHGARLLGEVQSVLERLRISPYVVEACDGELLAVRSASGPDALLASSRDNYFATPESARTAPRPWNFAGEPQGPLEKIHTPDRTSVADVCSHLAIHPSQIFKTLVFAAQSPIAIHWLVAVVRGDHQVNLHKLSKVAAEMGVTHIAIADSDEAMQRWPMGFVGPDAAMKLPDAVLVVDPDAAQGNQAWFAGGNERDYHVASFNWFRECGDKVADPTRTAVANIRNAVAGDQSPKNDGGVLDFVAVSFLAKSSHRQLHAMFDNAAGNKHPLWLATLAADPRRLLATIVENSHDADGIVWPPAVAPVSVVITPIRYESEVREAAERLYTQLCDDGIDVLLDDRDARPGVKFTDADLIGFPIRITLSTQSVRQEYGELKRRTATDAERVPLAELATRVRQALPEM